MCDLNDLILECKKAAGAANELAGAQKKLDTQTASTAQTARMSTEQMGKLKDATKGFISAISSGESPLKALAGQVPAITEVFAGAIKSGAPLKELLGGIVEAASPIAGVSAPVAGVAIALSAVASAAADAQKQSAAFKALAQGAGQDLGMTGGQLQALAETAADASHTSIANAESWTQAYVRMGVSNSTVLGQAVADTKGLAQVMGVDGAQASQLLGAALNDPIANLDALAKATGGFDYATRESIQSMARRGELAQADAAILKEVEGRTASTAGRVNTLSGAYDRAATSIGNYLQKAAKVLFTEPDPAAVEETYAGMGYNKAAEKRKAEKKRADDAAADSAVGAAARAAHEIADPKDRQIRDLNDQKGALLGAAKRGAGALKEAGLTKAQVDQDIRTLDGRIADLKKGGGASAAVRTASTHFAATAAPPPQYRGGDAIQAAKSAELSAQLSLTKNVEKIAKLKHDQIDVEYKTQNDRLRAQLKSGEINEADGAFLKEKYKSTVNAKHAAIDQERSAQLLQVEVARRQGQNNYLDQMDKFTADMVGTAAQKNQIELTSLKRRQEFDQYTLEKTNNQKIATGEIDVLDALMLEIQQEDLQQAETQATIRKQTVDAEKRTLDARVAGLQSTIDLAEGQKVLARSVGATRAIEARVLDLKHQQEVAAQQAIINGSGSTPEQKGDAERRLGVLNQTYANQVEAAQRLEVSYGDMSTSLKNAASALDQHDWLGVTKNLFDAFETFALNMQHNGASLESKIGAVAGLANGLGAMVGGKAGAALSGAGSGAAAGFQIGGPWGAAIGAALGGISGLLGASSAKAQAKVDALVKAQQDLQAKQQVGSNSIEQSLGLAGQYQNTDLEYSNAMLTTLRSIDSKIGAVAVSIAGQIKAGGLLSASGLGLGSTSSKGDIGVGLVGGGLAGAGLAGAGSMLLSGLEGALVLGPIALVAGAVGLVIGALTKTKKTVEVLDQGLSFTAQTFGQIAAGGVSGASYADLLTTTKKSIVGIGLSTKVSTSTVTGAVDPAILNQITGVIELLGRGVLEAAKVFGPEALQAAQSALESVNIDLGKMSLKGLSAEEIEKVLQATFDRVGDDLAAAGVPGLEELADVGEGAFETLVRLARQYQVVDTALASINKEFGDTGVKSLAARDALVEAVGGLDAFVSKTSFFAQHFLSDSEQLKPSIDTVNKGLAPYGLSAESTREQFKALVLAQDLMQEAGQKTYATLMDLAPAFDKVAEAAEATAKTANDNQQTNIGLMRQLMAMDDEVLGKTSARDAAREDELKALDETGKKLQKIVWARQDEAEAAEKRAAIRDKADSIQDQIDQFTKSPSELLAASRAKERAEAVKLDGSLGKLLDTLYALQDAAKVDEKRTSIQDRIDGLRLTPEEQLAKTRAKERAEAVALDPALGRLIDQLFDLEDAAKAAELATKRTALQNQILRAIGGDDNIAKATASERDQALKDLDPSLRAYQQALWDVEDANAAVTLAEQNKAAAVSDATQAYEKASSEIQKTVDKFKGFSDSLKTFRSSLNTGGLAMNDPLQQYARTKTDFERVAGLAAQGNEEALGQLQGVSEAYLEASKAAQADNIGYFRDLAAVKAATEAAEDYADQQVDMGEQQLKALEDQFTALGVINNSVMSVEAAITNLATATDALAKATAAKKALADNFDNKPAAPKPVAFNDNDSAELNAAKAIYLSATGGLDSAIYNKYAKSPTNDAFYWMRKTGYGFDLGSYGSAGDPEALRKKYGFKTGGSFTVGGSGGPDSQFMPLHLTPGEMVNVSRPDTLGALVEEIRGLRADNAALREEVADLKTATTQTAINTGRQVRLTERWDGDGLPQERTAA